MEQARCARSNGGLLVVVIGCVGGEIAVNINMLVSRPNRKTLAPLLCAKTNGMIKSVLKCGNISHPVFVLLAL
jgi:hypothetical protein